MIIRTAPAALRRVLVVAVIASLAAFRLPDPVHADNTVAKVTSMRCIPDTAEGRCNTLLYYDLKSYASADIVPLLANGKDLSSGDKQRVTIHFTTGRTHDFKLKGAASVWLTPSGVNPHLSRRALRPLQSIDLPLQPTQQDFLYLQYGELDETVDPGTTGIIMTGNTVVNPTAGTELDVAVTPEQQVPVLTSVAVSFSQSTAVDTTITVVQGSATVKSPGASDKDAVSMGKDQQLVVTPQSPPIKDNVQDGIDTTQVTSWIDDLPPTVTTPVLPDGEVGVTYSETLTASGGRAPLAWTLTGGALPAGLALAPDGTLSGTPTRSGRYTFSVHVADTAGGTNSISYTVAVTVPHSCGTNTASPCATVWMDKARYKYGEIPGLCYAVSEAGHVHIDVTKPDGSTVMALDAKDDGSGDCFSLGIPTGLPAGQRRVHLDLSVDGSVVAGADTTYTVVPGTCGTVPGQHCTAVWTDKSRYQVGDTARVCYSVPQPIYFQISDLTSDGQSDVVLAGSDDGTGGCVTAIVTPPVGLERLQLDVVSSTGARESASVTFQVLAAH